MLTKAWRAGVLPRPILEPEALVSAAACRERQELAGGPWAEALAVLAKDLLQSADLNALGRTIAHGLIVQLLAQRIRVRRLLDRRADIRDIRIEKPVIILGQMRSGTTRIHRLLACDPRFAYTRGYENLQPVPRARRSAIAKSALLRSFLHACNPRLRAIHPGRSSDAEEEFGLHAISLHGAMFEAQWSVPAFARWCEHRELESVYAEFHDLLRILRWRRKDSDIKVQLLKAPQFMQDLPAVLLSFPDARIIRLQREAADVIASGASLVWHQQRIQSDAADPGRVGAEWKRKTELREQRASAALSGFPSSRLLTVDYHATDRDWRGEVRRIYDFLDMKLNDAVVSAMRRSIDQSEHRGHRYSAQTFGLGD